MQTPLKRVRGSGSSGTGTSTFIAERITSVALLILTPVFLGIVIALAGRPHEEVLAILAHPFVAVSALAFIVMTVLHMQMGMRVIIEDYVHGGLSRTVSLLANAFFSWVIGLVAVFAVLKIAFTF